MGAHAYGCNGAREANERLAAANGGQVPPERRRCYLGFYDLLYRSIVAVSSTYYDVKLKWKPEGSDAHFQLDLLERRGMEHLPEGFTAKQRQKARQQDRLAVVAALAANLFGPRRHVCAVDINESARIEGIEIPYRPEPVSAACVINLHVPSR